MNVQCAVCAFLQCGRVGVLTFDVHTTATDDDAGGVGGVHTPQAASSSCSRGDADSANCRDVWNDADAPAAQVSSAVRTRSHD